MATVEMTQMIKVVIDGNRLFMENRGRNTEAETQTLQHQCEHRCCNTNMNCCNTNANTDAETQCWNRAGTQKLTQMVKVVIDDNRLVMEHAQVLEHRSWNTIADAGTQMLKHRHKCCNTSANTDVGWITDAGTRLLEHECWNTTAGTWMLKHDCWNMNAGTRLLNHRCWNVDAETRMLNHRYWNVEAETQMLDHRCWNADVGTQRCMRWHA